MENKHVARSRATREALVAAGRRLFGTRGFGAVGTEELVREAGVTRGALYHQFADKLALFDAVAEAVEADVSRRIAEGALAQGAVDPLGALRDGTAAFLDACAEPEVERILLRDAPAVLGTERWREISAQYGAGLVRGTLEAGMSSGAIAAAPLDALTHLLLGALSEGAVYVARAEDRATARADVLAVVDRLLAALAP